MALKIIRSILPVALTKRAFLSISLESNVDLTFSSRRFSDDNKVFETTRSVDWRKTRLDQLERKFTSKMIESDTELQPEWKSMESRVTRRRNLTKDELGGKTGRSNIRPTEEDVWLENGLYHANEDIKKG
jgi:hypothetical protein